MFRVLARRASVMILIVALSLVALPAAYARPLSGPHSNAGGASWISALSTWVSSFFLGTPTKAANPAFHARSAASTTSTSGTGTVGVMTGTCIDPNGHPIPCSGT